jgi:hypothetical protein
MKYFALTILPLLLVSCKKALPKVEDYFPVISMTATIQMDGSVLLEGSLLNEGADAIEVAGFCFSDSPNLSIEDNQLLVSDIAVFNGVYPGGFDPNKTYYFQAFAANSYGLGKSTIFELSGIESVPVVAPCTLAPNTYQSVNTGTINTFAPASFGFNKVTYSCSGSTLASMNVSFNTPPITGIYTTTSNQDLLPGQVHISANFGFASGVVNSGAEVYVNRLSETQFKVEVCTSQINVNSTNSSFRTNFTRNY